METINCDIMQNDNFTQHVEDRIHSIKSIFSKDECDELIKMTEKAGFNPSPPSGGGHGQTPRTGARTSQFYVKDDSVLADKIWKRLKDFIPKDLRSIKQVPYMNSVTKGDEFTPVGVNDHIRFYKYDPGQFILKHDDKYYSQKGFLFCPKTCL